jgi:hypothetical protein
MKSLDNFSVQPVGVNGIPDKAICIPVQARGPVQAAEIVLGETLVTQGPMIRLRALVWKLAEDYTPVRITLFVPG